MSYLLVLAAVLVGYANADILPESCGKPAINPDLNIPKVVGGNEAKPNSWPWQVQLRFNGNHYCGGSILNEKWILTAAHCVHQKNATSYSIRAGRHSKSGKIDEDKNEQIASAKQLIWHESYMSNTINNDVALIRLSTAFNFTDQVSPVCLTDSEPAGGTDAYLTGWGSVQGTCCDGKLKQAYLPIVARSICQTITYWGSRITPGMICAGHDDASQGGCNGDSGGPLVVPKNDTFYQVGIVSWGSSGCKANKKPTVFANQNYYNPWIIRQISAFEAEEFIAKSKKFHPRLGSAFARRAMTVQIDDSQI